MHARGQRACCNASQNRSLLRHAPLSASEPVLPPGEALTRRNQSARGFPGSPHYSKQLQRHSRGRYPSDWRSQAPSSRNCLAAQCQLRSWNVSAARTNVETERRLLSSIPVLSGRALPGLFPRRDPSRPKHIGSAMRSSVVPVPCGTFARITACRGTRHCGLPRMAGAIPVASTLVQAIHPAFMPA